MQHAILSPRADELFLKTRCVDDKLSWRKADEVAEQRTKGGLYASKILTKIKNNVSLAMKLDFWF